MEFARKAYTKDFKNIIGIEFKELCDIIKYIYNIYNPLEKRLYINHNEESLKTFMKDEVYSGKNEFLYYLNGYIEDYNPTTITDWLRISNWGVVSRNGKEKLVIVDNGVNEDILIKFYHG